MSLLGIDIGTSGCKAIIFSRTGQVLSSEYREYPLLHPVPGWSELDPELVISFVKNAIKTANQKIKKDRIKAFAVSCQGEAVIPVDRDGNSLYNAIVTFDSRTKEQCRFWEKTLGSSTIFKITGMPLNPMYSINKIMWLKKHRRDIFVHAYKFLCFEDFLQLKLGLEPSISYSLAARTAAFDIVNKKWSEKILKAAGIDEEMLSKPVEGAEITGELSTKICRKLDFEKKVICAGGGHDQACGAFGAGITGAGKAMHASGTSDTIIAVLHTPRLGRKMLLNNYPCAPYVMPGKYTILAFNLTGGLLLKWYREVFCRQENESALKDGKSVYKIIDENLSAGPVNIFILPHFVGSGTPWLDADSKGLIIGLDIESGKPQISRAVFESNAYDLKLNIERIKKIGIKVDSIFAIGGGAKSRQWLKIKADVLNMDFVTLKSTEAPSLGAAMLAGIAAGQYSSYNEAAETAVKTNEIIKPSNNYNKLYSSRYRIYKKIYRINKELLHSISGLSKSAVK
ncbi:MAG: hypothetical protein FJW68_02275 [Actinobacteria bacterium]|nr:hypothetical protein [Actinomycetota bacterium]